MGDNNVVRKLAVNGIIPAWKLMFHEDDAGIILSGVVVLITFITFNRSGPNHFHKHIKQHCTRLSIRFVVCRTGK